MIQRGGHGSRIAVTGLGAVSALGADTVALWAAVLAGRDGIRPIARFSTEGYATHLGAMVPDHDDRDPSPAEGALFLRFAVSAAREALAEARAEGACPPHRLALVLGSSLGTLEGGALLSTLTERVGDALGARGPRVTISTACASSTNALGLGKDLLDAGVADIVLAGGADTLTPEIFAGFHALGLLSAAPCAPFSHPSGTTLGEGAGFLVLERADEARARGASPLAALLGYGLSADAYHPTTPDPTGAGVARALRGALDDAGLTPGEIDYFNAHGTGTPANDPAEWRAVEIVFGDGAARLPVSSTKSMLGHAQGAAGVLEAITTLLCMRRGMIPPTLHFAGRRPRAPSDPVGEARPRPCNVRRALCSNSAFGGANAAVVLGEAALAGEAPRRSTCGPPESGPRRRRPVAILGAGAVGPHGDTLDDLARAFASGALLRGQAPEVRIEALVPTADPRGLDRGSRMLAVAAARALDGAGIALRGSARERAGLFVGAARVSAESVAEHRASVAARGLQRLSASAFTRLVLNAPAGACSKLLSLRGPTTTLTTGAGSGLVALAYAAFWLSTRSDADLLLAGGLDELAPAEREPGRGEGAALLVLSSGAPRALGGPAVALAGWGLAGPGRVEEAIAAALAAAELGPSDVRRLPDPAEVLGRAASVGAVFACAAAFAAIARGEVERALVADPGDGSAACAVVLAATGDKDG